MTLWVRGFVGDTLAVQAKWLDVLEAAERRVRRTRGTTQAGPSQAMVRVLRRAYLDFNNELRITAERAAVMATTDMRARLKGTTVRPDTGESPHLRDLIFAKPLSTGRIQTGWVGVGLVAELERARNRNSPGYGSYWRAQEYGTGRSDPRGGRITVPSQIGRVIYGAFAAAGGGDLTRPLAMYSGGGGPHPVFLMKRPVYGSSAERDQIGATGTGGTRSGPAGMGTIAYEVPPKLFITYGADAAEVWWREQIARVETHSIDRLMVI